MHISAICSLLWHTKTLMNMALVMNLKGAVGNANDSDVNIKIDKGVVFIDISDKMLFNSGSYTFQKMQRVYLRKLLLF